MALKLAVPPLEQKTDLTAETSPKQVQEWLDRLPKANIIESVRALRDGLYLLNRHKLGHDARLKLVELYHQTAATLLPGMEVQFSGVPLPLPEKQRQVANLARDLLVELANGYKIIVLDESKKRLSFSSNKQLSLVIQRALAALSRVLVVCYQTYAPTSAGIWSEMHELFRYAVQQNLQDESVSETNGTTSSVNLIYKQALLLALADPYRLLQGEVSKIMDFLARFGNQAQLMPLAQTTSPSGFFLVRLDSDKPPKAVAQNVTVTDARSDILLNTIELARLIHQQITRLEAGETPRSQGLADTASEPAYLDLMRRMIRFWGIAPKRHFTRLPNQASVNICAGLRTVHYFINGQKQYPNGDTMESYDSDITVKFSSSPIDRTSQQTFVSTQWTIVNESAGGLALTKASADVVQIRVGEVVGLKPEKLPDWNVGVVRWVKSDNPAHIELGVQMLAPKALPAIIKPVISAADVEFLPALILPEMPILKQAAALLTPHGLFQEMREFQLDQGGIVSTIRATKLLEQTHSFDVFTFSAS
jgi:hypothetical protein